MCVLCLRPEGGIGRLGRGAGVGGLLSPLTKGFKGSGILETSKKIFIMGRAVREGRRVVRSHSGVTVRPRWYDTVIEMNKFLKSQPSRG